MRVPHHHHHHIALQSSTCRAIATCAGLVATPLHAKSDPHYLLNTLMFKSLVSAFSHNVSRCRKIRTFTKITLH